MSATARVRVTLEIDVNSTWGDDCSVGQIYKQAIDQANGLLRRAFDERRLRDSSIGNPCGLNPDVRIVGEIEPLAVISRKDGARG